MVVGGGGGIIIIIIIIYRANELRLANSINTPTIRLKQDSHVLKI